MRKDEFDQRFDDGEDMTPYLDRSTVRRRDVARSRAHAQLASSGSDNSPATSAGMIPTTSSSGASIPWPLRPAKTAIVTKATRLLPSTNG
jgi:hypothetical protein